MSELNIPSYKLPAEAYFEDSWLEQEKLKLFANSWLYAGQESELLDRGSYKTMKAGHNELVIVRDKQGNLNAFHNVCRHRGAQLVQGKGQCSTLVCPYHKWGYGLDGKLRGIASRDQFDQLDTESLGLHKASVSTWMGLIFVHSDENPLMTLTDWLGAIDAELKVFETDKLQLLKTDSFTFDANWKLYIENHIDWLHLWYVHPETLGALKHEDGEFKQHGIHWASFDPVKDDYKEAFQSSNPLIDLPSLETKADKYAETGAHFLFPNLPIFTGSSFFIIAELVPISPVKTQMNVNVLGLPGGDIDAFLTLFNLITKDEDAHIIENIQRNVRNKHYAVGPIAHTYEKAISDFHDNYLMMME